MGALVLAGGRAVIGAIIAGVCLIVAFVIFIKTPPDDDLP